MWLKCCKYKIDDFQVLILTPFWVSFWRCFGSPNGGQGHQKATSKKHQKNDAQNEPKLVPKGVPKWNQNRQKWGLGSTLFQGWLPSGLQTPSRIDFGEVLGPFWDHFRQFFWHMFSDFCKHSLAACCKQKRSKSQGVIKKNAAESFQETACLFAPSCIGTFTSER